MKHRIMKIIFIISLIPIVVCIGSGIVSAINGIDYATMSGDIPEKIYGLKAFWEAFLSLLFALSMFTFFTNCFSLSVIY